MKFRRFSSLKDPARASRLILQYEKDLIGTYRWYKERAVDMLTTGRALEAVPPKVTLDPDQYAANLATLNRWHDHLVQRVVLERTKEGYYRGVMFAQKGLKPYKIEVSLNLPYDQTVIRALQSRNIAAIKGVTEETSKQVMREVTTGALNGDTIHQIAVRISGTVEKVSYLRARVIARTELMKSVNEGIRKRFASSGIEKLQRVATADERTCKDYQFVIGGNVYQGCAGLAGKVFTQAEAAEIDEQTHPNCRCTFVPWIEGVSK